MSTKHLAQQALSLDVVDWSAYPCHQSSFLSTYLDLGGSSHLFPEKQLSSLASHLAKLYQLGQLTDPNLYQLTGPLVKLLTLKPNLVRNTFRDCPRILALACQTNQQAAMIYRQIFNEERRAYTKRLELAHAQSDQEAIEEYSSYCRQLQLEQQQVGAWLPVIN